MISLNPYKQTEKGLLNKTSKSHAKNNLFVIIFLVFYFMGPVSQKDVYEPVDRFKIVTEFENTSQKKEIETQCQGLESN